MDCFVRCTPLRRLTLGKIENCARVQLSTLIGVCSRSSQEQAINESFDLDALARLLTTLRGETRRGSNKDIPEGAP